MMTLFYKLVDIFTLAVTRNADIDNKIFLTYIHENFLHLILFMFRRGNILTYICTLFYRNLIRG